MHNRPHTEPNKSRRHFLSFLGLSPLLLASGSVFNRTDSELNLDFRLIRACRSGDLATVKKLVNAGADVNKRYLNDIYLKNPDCEQDHELPRITPLLVATNNDHLEIVKFLLDKRSDPNHHCYYEGGSKELPIYKCKSLAVLRTLVGAGADVNLVVNDYPILMQYSDRFDFFEYLIDHGANVHAEVWGASILNTMMSWNCHEPIDKKVILKLLENGYGPHIALKEIDEVFNDLKLNLKNQCITPHEYGRHVGFLESYKKTILKYQAGLVKSPPPKRMVFEQENGRWKIYLQES